MGPPLLLVTAPVGNNDNDNECEGALDAASGTSVKEGDSDGLIEAVVVVTFVPFAIAESEMTLMIDIDGVLEVVGVPDSTVGSTMGLLLTAGDIDGTEGEEVLYPTGSTRNVKDTSSSLVPL